MEWNRKRIERNRIKKKKKKKIKFFGPVFNMIHKYKKKKKKKKKKNMSMHTIKGLSGIVNSDVDDFHIPLISFFF